jgi:hypothetical protein
MFLERVAADTRPLVVYCANVPDKERLWDYYDTDEKKAFYFQREAEGRPHMGTWYNRIDIIRLAERLGLSCRFVEIGNGLNTHYYRFDVLFSKILLK